MPLHSISAPLLAQSDRDGRIRPLTGVEARIFRDLLVVIAAGELSPGAFVAEGAVIEIYAVEAEVVRRVFRAMEQVGIISFSSAVGAYVEAIAPGDVFETLDRARTLNRHIVEGLATSGLDPVGHQAIVRHIDLQAAAEARRADWSRINILGTEFLALLPHAAKDKDSLPDFNRHAMRLMMVRARYDLFGEALPSVSFQRLLLTLIEKRKPDEAQRLVDKLYDAIGRSIWLDRGAESADLRKALARLDLARAEPERPKPYLVAINGQRLDI